MEYAVQKVAVSSINFEDKTFIISTQTNNGFLQKSIERVGLLNPPYLYFDSVTQYFQIVCGYRRIQSCVACGWQEIPARIIASDTSQRELFLFSLYDNLAHRMFNPIEQALAAAKLLTYFTEDTVIRDYLPLMGLHPTCKTLDSLRCLAALEPAMQDAVEKGTIPEAIAIKLANLGVEDRKAFMDLFSQVHLSLSKQEEILTYCNDISLRDSVSCREILNDAAVRQIVNQNKLSRSQKGDQVRAWLRKRRFPRLTQREDKFLQQQKKLQLPPGVQLMPPPLFEGQTFRLQIEFDDQEALRERTVYVVDLVKNNNFNDLLEDC
jgi:ParB family chromosome partitioning protein